ncbi:Serine/threonine-protein kinase 33 [Actinomortierella ambigua]|uniref:non-specific serine/threonine protein kinase n=1 Tax=Actinomortierella ambigua TaxID=1343610 RepID=A0A9P6PQQ3_9FUNG|nr:Serine/threonine-protein kinase 33 [Actinomortierella ambigua]
MLTVTIALFLFAAVVVAFLASLLSSRLSPPLSPHLTLADSVTCDPNPPSYRSFESDRALYTSVAEDPADDPQDSSHSALASAVASLRSVGQNLASTAGLWADLLKPQSPETLLSIWQPDPVDRLARLANNRSEGLAGWIPEKIVGQGGYGTVYLVHEVGTKIANRAAKVVKQQYDTTLALLRREARIHTFLRDSHAGECHPNIVRLDSVQEEPGVMTLVMEHCAGGNLEDQENRVGPRVFSDAAVAQILLPVAMGLSHLHEVGIAHRDMKLQNVLLDAQGTAKIGDFGLATQEALCRDRVGTPSTMAPEVFNRKHPSLSPYDPKKADMWALGILFWQLKFGDLPWREASFDAKDDFDLYVDNPTAFLLLTPGMGYGSAPFLSQTMCLDPAQRISADQAVRALEAIIKLG